MSARQLIVLAIAGIAAVAAIFIVRGAMSGGGDHATATAEPVAGQQVLVAARNVAQGAALAPSDLAVALFPDSSIAPTFVNVSTSPSAQAEYVGAVTRRAFVQGEPIITTAVIQPDGHGFMAAQLEPGNRAVAIEISADSAAGGYIQPNDRVDVIVTSHIQHEGAPEEIRSDIVLQDIRVLALGETTQTQTSGEAPAVIQAGVAVLEMSAEDARTLALADELGTIDLALRGVQAETVGMRGPSNRQGSLGQGSGTVRVHQFGTVTGGGR